MKVSQQKDAIIFLDIRNFSAHRQFLARARAGRPLSTLIRKLLESAVFLSKSYMRTHRMTQLPLLNHTGDGFVLVLRGGKSCLAALRFASEFREITQDLIACYQADFFKKPKKGKHTLPPPLHYGIGLHCGEVTAFAYQGFKTKRVIFLGSAVNIASRVEGCTKDHPYSVLCTKRLLDRAKKDLGKPAPFGFDKYCIPIGLHNLRGLEGPVHLIRCEPGLHSFLYSRWKTAAIGRIGDNRERAFFQIFPAAKRKRRCASRSRDQ
jgi:class 3 adenylate cyclase